MPASNCNGPFILLSNIVIEIEIIFFILFALLNYPSIITTIGTITCQLHSKMSGDYIANTLLNSPRIDGNNICPL